MTDISETADFFGPDDLPAANPDGVKSAYKEIIGRHFLAVLRNNTGLTLEHIARRKGVTKAAVHQLEKRPFGNLKISSVVDQCQALGYDVDEDWVARTLAAALPPQNFGTTESSPDRALTNIELAVG